METRHIAIGATFLWPVAWGLWQVSERPPAREPAAAASAFSWGSGSGTSGGAESLRWSSDNQFSRFYRARPASPAASSVDLRPRRAPAARETLGAALAGLSSPVREKALRLTRRLPELEREDDPGTAAYRRYLRRIQRALAEGRTRELLMLLGEGGGL